MGAAHSNIVLIDLDGPLKHCEDPIVGGAEMHEDGAMILPDEPGLGVEVSGESGAGQD
jgi:L-alanine-DL-glutamate epimerase-like enolase superfamily enzyme